MTAYGGLTPVFGGGGGRRLVAAGGQQKAEVGGEELRTAKEGEQNRVAGSF